MTTLEIILLAAFVWFAIMTCAIFTFFILKSKIKFKAEVIKGHRNLWIFYHENYNDFKDIFENNGKDIDVNEKQTMFLVMLFNQMELVYNAKKYDMLPRTFDFVDDYKGIMANKTIRKFWETNRIYRDKSFAKYVDKMIKEA